VQEVEIARRIELKLDLSDAGGLWMELEGRKPSQVV
jgi:hypothetical protein